MSLIPCQRCDVFIDTDDDPGAFIENPYNSKDVEIVCEACRERAWDRQQEHLAETGGGPSLIEQQREAWKLK